MVKDGTDCMVMNTTYRMDCNHCPEDNNNRSVYLGCSGKSVHNRMREHGAKVLGEKEENSMAKHMSIHHSSIPKDQRSFTATILAKHRSTLTRFTDEAVRLAKTGNLANSKGEWGCGGLVRLVPSRQDKQQEYSDNREQQRRDNSNTVGGQNNPDVHRRDNHNKDGREGDNPEVTSNGENNSTSENYDQEPTLRTIRTLRRRENR